MEFATKMGLPQEGKEDFYPGENEEEGDTGLR